MKDFQAQLKRLIETSEVSRIEVNRALCLLDQQGLWKRPPKPEEKEPLCHRCAERLNK